MKQITTLFIALAITSAISAQLIQFQKTYDGSGPDYCWSVAQTSDGGYILAGESNSIGSGSYDAYLTKTDAYGTVQWTKAYGGTGWDWARKVKQTSDGGYIVVGGTESSGNGLGDMWIFKTNSSGSLMWQRTAGGTGGDGGNDIIQTTDGGYAAAGFQEDAATSYNACLAKLDGSGGIQWIHSYSVGVDEDYANSVAQTSDGGYLMGGENFDQISSKALVIKTDANGSVSWANTYGGSIDHWINSVKALPSGDVLVAGVTSQVSSVNIWLAKLNPNGNPVWSTSYAGPGSFTDNCLYVTSTSDGGFILSGRTNSFTADFEAFLLKTDSAGGPEWSKRYGGSANDAGNQVVQSTNSGYALACNSLSFGTAYCAYFIKTDTSGASLCNESNTSFISSNISTSFLNVSVLDSTLTNVASASLLLTSPTLTETSLCFIVGDEELMVSEDLISVYPNPASNQFTIYDLRFAIENVEIYSSLGEKIFSQEHTAYGQQQKVDIDTHSWSVGVYFVRIKTESGIVVKKLVKQ